MFDVALSAIAVTVLQLLELTVGILTCVAVRYEGVQADASTRRRHP